MPDNTPDARDAAPAAPFALPGHRVLALAGRDAVAFAQAQFCNDVAALADGHWQWNGWLTPKGRIIALFALLRLDAGTLWLLLPDRDPAELAERLQRFVFRSQVALAARDDVQACGVFAAPLQAQDDAFARSGDGSIELDLSAAGGARSLRLEAGATADAGAALHWTRFDLAHGLPRLPAAQAERWTPQQLSLERLRAYSIRKGCYPGQEIVARTHFLGQAKRELVRLKGVGSSAGDAVMPATPGHPSAAMAQAIGEVVCAAGDEALAVMPVDAGDGPFATARGQCARWPLIEGLAR